MKRLFLVGAVAILASCDVYKGDTPIAVVPQKVQFITGQQRLFTVTAANLASADSLQLTGLTSGATAEVVKDNFVLFTPGTSTSETLGVNLLKSSGELLSKSTVELSKSTDGCGIAAFDYAEIEAGGSITINLVDNDKICQDLNSGAITLIDVENSDGFEISINLPNNSVDLSYKAPAGFHGTAKVIYAVGVQAGSLANLKEPFYNYPEQFKYLLLAMATVNVK